MRFSVNTVSLLHEKEHLDTSVIHSDGTTTAAKKGGDNLGFNGHKHMEGDKVVAFCDRNCNLIASFVTATGNLNESTSFEESTATSGKDRFISGIQSEKDHRQLRWCLRLQS